MPNDGQRRGRVSVTDPDTKKLTDYLDTEFAKRAGHAHPKVIFRSKDVVAGCSAALCGAKFLAQPLHKNRVTMGQLLHSIVRLGGDFGDYQIEPTSGNRDRGIQYMATRRKRDDPK